MTPPGCVNGPFKPRRRRARGVFFEVHVSRSLIARMARHLAAVWLVIVLFLGATAAFADTGLCWSRAGTVESWQKCEAGRQVWSRATVGAYGDYARGTFRDFAAVPATEAVYVCEADRPIGAGEGCPTPGTYNRERFVLKSSIAPPPPPPPAAPTLTLTASSATVLVPGTVTLTYAVANATSCALTGDWSGSVAGASGSTVSNVSQIRGYSWTMTCTGPGGSVSRTVTATGVFDVERACGSLQAPADFSTVRIADDPSAIDGTGASTRRCIVWTQRSGQPATICGNPTVSLAAWAARLPGASALLDDARIQTMCRTYLTRPLSGAEAAFADTLRAP